MRDKTFRRKNRINNSKRNISVSSIVMVASAILMYFERMVFVANMPISYVGLYGLFTNIFNYLSIADLGINIALMYCLYEPIANEDLKAIRSIMSLVRKIFLGLGWFIFVGGLICAAFIHYIVRPEDMVPNIRIFLVMFILSQAVTYWCGYKSILIDANQQQYITVSAVQLGNCIQLSLQMLFIMLFKNYFVYLLILDIVNIGKYVYISRKADKIYPYISHSNKAPIEPVPVETYKHLKHNMVPMLFHKLGNTVITSTDTIFLSIMFGTTILGKYNNYLLLSNSFMSVFWIIARSLTSSIGDMCIDESSDNIMNVYNQMLFGNFLLSSISGVMFITISQSFIDLSFGVKNELPSIMAFALGFNLFLVSMRICNSTFRDAMGLFAPDWYKPILESITNIAFSYILGKWLGPVGIVLGTTVAYVGISFWIETYVVVHLGIKKHVIGSYLKLFLYFAVFGITAYISMLIANLVNINSAFVRMIIQGLIGIIIPSIVCFTFTIGSRSARAMFGYIFAAFRKKVTR